MDAKEVLRHATEKDCWVILYNQAWDVTDFLDQHPGGKKVILKYAGRDATEEYDPIHPTGLLEETLSKSHCKGPVEGSTIQKPVVKPTATAKGQLPPLSNIISFDDFAKLSQDYLSAKAWAYYSSGSCDQISLRLNEKAFQKVLFRPQVLIDVESVSTRIPLLGYGSSLPVFVSPAGMAKLSHPEGEKAISKGAGQIGVIQCISSNASCTVEEVRAASHSREQVHFFQVYVNRDRAKAKQLIKRAVTAGVKALFVTVDAPAPGKREADERLKAVDNLSAPNSESTSGHDGKGAGIGRQLGSYIDPKLSWKDIAWIQSISDLPVVVKGIQSARDAKLASEHGCKAIYLSNHGGRALDTAPPGLYTLLEMRRFCPEVFELCEVYLDGGVRRGTDVLKAVCLGATAVGLGRPVLYALPYGSEGVAHLLDIIRDELETAMRLVGITSLNQAGPHLINTRAIDHLVPSESTALPGAISKL